MPKDKTQSNMWTHMHTVSFKICCDDKKQPLSSAFQLSPYAQCHAKKSLSVDQI